MEKIILTTQDNVRIVGNYYTSAEGVSQSAIILLHAMPATKESWDAFAIALQQKGFHVLAIDERGHGESTIQILEDGTQKTLDYRKFSDEDHQAKKLDIAATRAFFEEKGIEGSRIFIGGASIGANLAIQYLAEHPECPAAFALSPGLNYHGVMTEQYAKNIKENQRLFLAAAKDDTHAAFQAVEKLAKEKTSQITVKTFDEGGHGTTLFSTHPELMEELVQWFTAH